MLSMGSVAFLSPWILAGLLALPVIWWLLRVLPPAPKTQIFAGVRLLLGLEDRERQTNQTPWWLLLLRCLVIAAALIGFSQPVTNLTTRLSGASGPLLVVMEQGWAAAPDWAERSSAARAILDEAAEAGRDVVFWPTAATEAPPLMSATSAIDILTATTPVTWATDHAALAQTLEAAGAEVAETIWLHDGLSGPGTADLMAAVTALGPLRLLGPEAPANALTPPRLEDGVLTADVLSTGAATPGQVIAFARAKEGGERRIAVATPSETEDGRLVATFDLPSELQGTVTRIVLADRPSAGGAAFADGAIRRISVGLVAADAGELVTTLTSPTHYLERALAPWADVERAELGAVLDSEPAAIVLADHGDFAAGDRTRLTEWVEAGGLLIRFSGQRLAASIGAQGFGSSRAEDPLLPVQLRRGGRVLGGALAWTTPRALGPFPTNSPFKGLERPEEVDIRTQVLAQPSPELSERVWAALDDGTPLVTASTLGSGRVVLFHISANAEWSSLPLSGLFVEMLGRLTALAPGRNSGPLNAEALEGTLWRAETLMDANGASAPASSLSESVPGIRLGEPAAADLPPGVYVRADSSDSAPLQGAYVVNLFAEGDTLTPLPEAPAGTTLETLGGEAPERYGPWLLALAIILAFADAIATLFVSGRIGGRVKPALAVLLACALLVPPDALAQQQDDVDPGSVLATAETTLGYVLTGDSRVDRISERGIVGLGEELTRRTAIEPGPPVGVRPGRDELSFYPVLYWPLTAGTVPDPDGLSALARYLDGGGMLIIDTQNGSSGFGSASSAQLRDIARALNLPPLAPVDESHVLTRAFYLLSSFPGRWRNGRVWTEAAPQRADGTIEQSDIPQFDRVDDNVSPVIVGSADWASAWAVDERGFPLYPVGRPGDRQREMALRFGVNAVMYALTGNYKSDQVHAPAVLQRLGQ